MTTTIPTLQSASLYFHEGNSNKEYHAAIEPRNEGYIVTFAYGRRGNTLTTGTKTSHPVSLAEATKVFDKLIAIFEDESSKTLFTFYPDEITFSANEFIGLTEAEAHALFHRKDSHYLRS